MDKKAMKSLFYFYVFFVVCGELLIINGGGDANSYCYLVEIVSIPTIFILLNMHSYSSVQKNVVRYFVGNYGLVYDNGRKKYYVRFYSIIRSVNEMKFRRYLDAQNNILGYFYFVLSNYRMSRDEIDLNLNRIKQGIMKMKNCTQDLSGCKSEYAELLIALVGFLEYYIIDDLEDEDIIKLISDKDLFHDYIHMLLRNKDDYIAIENVYNRFVKIIDDNHIKRNLK